jgi:hypothetical protein
MTMNLFLRFIMCGFWATGAVAARADDTNHTSPPTVGIPRLMKDLILPGSELEAAPLSDRRAPIVVRIVRSTPHGTAWRYDVNWYGLEPGDFDLRASLRRKDGSSTGDLPPLPVKVVSSLPPVFTPVHDPPVISIGGFGKYRVWLAVLAVGWVLVLLAMVAIGRRRRSVERAEPARSTTFAERIRPLVERGVAGTITPTECASLERLLIEHWAARLNLCDKKPAHVIRELRGHAEAGVLVGRLERWLHRPAGSADVDETPDDVPRLLHAYLSDLPEERIETVNVE